MHDATFKFFKSTLLHEAKWMRMMQYEYLTPAGDKRVRRPAPPRLIAACV